MRLAGLAAVLAGSTAILLTPVFATAYFLAYSEYDAAPFWMAAVGLALAPWSLFLHPLLSTRHMAGSTTS